MSFIRAFDNIKFYTLLVLLALTFSACNITKQLRDSQQYLYNGAKVKVKGEIRSDVTTPITDLVKQKPNKKFLGITKLKMRMYYLGSRWPETKLGINLREKFGEQPSILDTAFIESSVKSMRGYLKSVGFYYPDITYKVKTYRRRAFVTYQVNTNKVYHVGSYQINCADRQLYDVLKAHEQEAIIVPGHRLYNERLIEEQKRVVDLIRNSGYYTFSDEFVVFDVDTANGNWMVDVSVNVMNKGMYEKHQKHYVRNVYINIDPNYPTDGFKNQDTLKSRSFYYVHNRYKLNAKVLEQNLFLHQGDVFNQQTINRTYQRMGDLNAFKFVNIVPNTYTLNDTQYVDYQIKLSPNIKYDYVIEPQAILSDQNNSFTNNQTSNGNYGVAAILQFNNRNAFKNAEFFKLTFRSSFESQGRVSGTRWFNATEQSLTASLTFPRLVYFPKLDQNINLINTKTILTTSGIYELNTNFERRVFTSGIIYQLNKKYASFYVTPFEISYTKNTVNSDTLNSLINQDIYLFSMFSNNLILGSRFGFTYTDKQKAKGKNFVYLRWDAIELSGNVATAINSLLGSKKNENGTYNIFDVNYSQFVKSAIDFRFNKKIDVNNAYVLRTYAGVGIPYGNSPKFLPFERRFWVGGANSLRAWLPRSLGPGSFYQPGLIDYSGDIKLELNGEFRFNVYHRWFEAAVFADAGNVWMSKQDPARPNAHFAFDRFWKEFGIGGGLGARLNFEVILVRFDFAVPFHDPSLPESTRWVIKSFNQTWLFDNLNFNFGIGYPF